jgi:hypothetical protein
MVRTTRAIQFKESTNQGAGLLTIDVELSIWMVKCQQAKTTLVMDIIDGCMIG